MRISYAGYHPDLHGLTHSFPTRRSSDLILMEKCVRERTGNESLFEDESDPENGCGLPPKLGVPRTPQPLGQARCLRLRLGRTIRSLRCRALRVHRRLLSVLLIALRL